MQVLKSQNHTYTMTVPSSFLNEGHWKIAMYNPTRLDTIEFSIVARLRAYCPNKCTSPDQGTCNADGSCTCRNGYSGADCGFKANACQVNTFRSEVSSVKVWCVPESKSVYISNRNTEIGASRSYFRQQNWYGRIHKCKDSGILPFWSVN